jgi:hypothetical protein
LSLSSRADVQKFHDLNSSTNGGTITAGTGICTPGILLATEKAKSKNNATSSILKKEPSLRDHGNISAEAARHLRARKNGHFGLGPFLFPFFAVFAKDVRVRSRRVH